MRQSNQRTAYIKLYTLIKARIDTSADITQCKCAAAHVVLNHDVFSIILTYAKVYPVGYWFTLIIQNVYIVILIRSRQIVRKHGFLKVGFCFSRSGACPGFYFLFLFILIQTSYADGYFAFPIPFIADKICYRFNIK